MPENISSQIESLLFVSNQPLTVKDLSKFLNQSPEVIIPALEQLVISRQHGGVIILDNNGEYQMATHADNSTVVKNFLNAELREKLTDASIEVLGIIAYRQPISKAEIEAIRGVNSQYSLRHLLMRGLIEKAPSPHDARSVVYQTTTEFLSHLGMQSIKDLPEFEKLVEQIKLPDTPKFDSATLSPTASLPSSPATLEPMATEPTKVSDITQNTKLTEKADDYTDDDEDDEDDEEDNDDEGDEKS